jgi:hypothetical protein
VCFRLCAVSILVFVAVLWWVLLAIPKAPQVQTIEDLQAEGFTPKQTLQLYPSAYRARLKMKLGMMHLRPMPLVRTPEPFDHDRFLFELKHDGFRALAFIRGHQCELVSRRGHVYGFHQLAEESKCEASISIAPPVALISKAWSRMETWAVS